MWVFSDLQKNYQECFINNGSLLKDQPWTHISFVWLMIYLGFIVVSLASFLYYMQVLCRWWPYLFSSQKFYYSAWWNHYTTLPQLMNSSYNFPKIVIYWRYLTLPQVHSQLIFHNTSTRLESLLFFWVLAMCGWCLSLDWRWLKCPVSRTGFCFLMLLCMLCLHCGKVSIIREH